MTMDDEELETWMSESEGAVEEEPVTSLEVSLNSVMGIDNPKTMKMVGTINGREIVVMIDPGATHNFIAPRAVEMLKLRVQGTKEFAVSLGTWKAIRGWGEC